MAEKISITFAEAAIKDPEDMQAYYSDEGVPEVGKSLATEIIARIERLVSHPFRGA